MTEHIGVATMEVLPPDAGSYRIETAIEQVLSHLRTDLQNKDLRGNWSTLEIKVTLETFADFTEGAEPGAAVEFQVVTGRLQAQRRYS